MLTLENVNSGYGSSQVLFNVSLNVEKGSITAVIGPNGSGKSTLLKTIFGLTDIYSGSIKFAGEEITKKKPHEIAKKGIVYLSQVGNLFQNLTVRENLIIAGYVLPKEKLEARIKEVIQIFPLLKNFMERQVSMMSGGERQLLAIACALLKEPSLILFDEPTTHLSPKFADMIEEKIRELNSMGITVLLVEQDVKRAFRISDTTYILVAGRVYFQGKSSELIKHEKLNKLFFGLES